MNDVNTNETVPKCLCKSFDNCQILLTIKYTSACRIYSILSNMKVFL